MSIPAGFAVESYVLSDEDSSKCMRAGLFLAWAGFLNFGVQVTANICKIMKGEELSGILGIMVSIFVGALIVGVAVFSTRPVSLWRDKSFRWMHTILAGLIIVLQILDAEQALISLLGHETHNEIRSIHIRQNKNLTIFMLICACVGAISMITYIWLFQSIAKIHLTYVEDQNRSAPAPHMDGNENIHFLDNPTEQSRPLL